MIKLIRGSVFCLFLVFNPALASLDCESEESLTLLHKRIIKIFTTHPDSLSKNCSDRITFDHQLLTCSESFIKANFSVKTISSKGTFQQSFIFNADLRGDSPKVTFRPSTAKSFKKFSLNQYTMNLEYKSRPSNERSSKIKINFKLDNSDNVETFKISKRLSGWFQKTKTWKCFN